MSEHEVPDMNMIIIKRGHAHEEHPHGGAWKVAFADFMTAMMAFFLVLWIVNSTNKETRSSVARYFNPIRISDTTAARKGLKDPREVDFDASAAAVDEKPSAKQSGVQEEKGGANATKGGPGADHFQPVRNDPDEAMLDPITARDPFIALDEIAAQAKVAASTGRGASADPDLVYAGSARFRDPFAPPAPVLPSEANPTLVQTARTPQAQREQRSIHKAPEAATGAETEQLAAPERGREGERSKESGERGREAKTNLLQQAMAEAASLRDSISRVLREVGLGQGPRLEVRALDEGILISLTDDLNFTMFAVGSAEPNPRIVRAMERIGQLLSVEAGTFVVRGHTDARPFRSRAYDNWRLSSARGQMAAYMLMRGKLDEKRIERIEGHADRALRNASDPLAAENRRIEILLRRSK